MPRVIPRPGRIPGPRCKPFSSRSRLGSIRRREFSSRFPWKRRERGAPLMGRPVAGRTMARKSWCLRYPQVAKRSWWIGGLRLASHHFLAPGRFLPIAVGVGWGARGSRSCSGFSRCGWPCEAPPGYKQMRQPRSRMPRRQQANPPRSQWFLPWCQPRPSPLWRLRPLWHLHQPPLHQARSQRVSTANSRAMRAPCLLQSVPVPHVWRCERPRKILRRAGRLCAEP